MAPDVAKKCEKALNGERRRMLLTPEQATAMASMESEELETARRVVARFNDLVQLVEDGFFPEQPFYDKHHVMVLRCCHLVEPIRQHLEDESEGGNYGRRLPSMRATAARYYDRAPKNRDAVLHISSNAGRRPLYRTKHGPLRRIRARWVR